MASDGRGAEEPARLRPPGLGLLLAEARGIFELNASLLLSPLLLRAPRGDGHPVLTLPGFLAGDLSMAPMRRYLKELGYDTRAWQMGRNIGGVARLRAALRDRRDRRVLSGASQRDIRRPAGASDLDLFAQRRYRELAHLPPASLRDIGEYRGLSRQPYRARRQPGSALGGRRSARPR